MNVFVLCTGRSGSVTFVRACQHITNYSAGHETRSKVAGPHKMDYPDQHIEADNRLSWHLGLLDERYGDDAFYVHLRRDPETVAQSFVKRWSGVHAIAPAYRDAILMGSSNRIDSMRDMVSTMTANIRLFLKDKSNTLDVDLADADRWFPEFWDRIAAKGDLAAATAEWSVRANATRPLSLRTRVRRRVAVVKRALYPPE